MTLPIDMIDPNIGKRLFDVADPTNYLNEFWTKNLEQHVFCESCGGDYKLGERVIDYPGQACCPSKCEDSGCDATSESLVQVESTYHLKKLRARVKTAAPF